MRARIVALLLVPLLALAAVLALSRLPAAEIFALKTSDLQFRLFADPRRHDPRIVLVEVDQASLDHFDRDNISFPWPRSLYNPLVEYCVRGGAKAVLFDVLFNNSSPYGEETDAEFAAAIRASGRVYLAAAFSEGVAAGPGLDARFGLPYTGPAPAALERGAVSLPLPPLREAVAGIGNVIVQPDADGVYRRVPLGVLFRGRFVPGLAAAPVAARAASVRFEPGRLLLGDRAIPVDERGNLIVRFHGGRRTYQAYSAAGVITSALAAAEGRPTTVSAAAFRDAYVVVGYAAPGLYDLKATPLSSKAPAFEMHAVVLDNLLHGDFLAAAPAAVSAAAAFTAAAVVGAAVLFLPVWGAAAAVAALGAGLFAATGAAFRAGTLLDLWSVAAAALFALVGTAVYRYQTEGRQRRFLASAFSRYVSPKLVHQLIADPKRLALGGERRELTLFFSDLQGFTSIAETTTPQQLVAFLNEYTTLMAGVVYEYDGTVDKYIGDAVMAFWGAPLPQPDHARRALLAALTCQERLLPFVERLAAAGGPRLVTRIGLNTGECVVGNMGSRDRFDYTAIGDTVNQASRLEGINKVYGTLVLASETAWSAAGGVAYGRLVDRVRVKGKERPVALYEPLAVAGAETPRMRLLKERYEEAFAAYAGRAWERALELTGEILRDGEDGPSRVLAERARAFLAEPPPPAWDGVYTARTK
jgi:adenylate cyclase